MPNGTIITHTLHNKHLTGRQYSSIASSNLKYISRSAGFEIFPNCENMLWVISRKPMLQVLDWPNPSFASLQNLELIQLNVINQPFWRHITLFRIYLFSQAEASCNTVYRHKKWTVMNVIVSLCNCEFVWWQWLCFCDFNGFRTF